MSERHEFVEIAFWLAVFFAVATLLLLVYLVWFRLRNFQMLRQRREVETAWDPVFRAMRGAVPVSKPDVSRQAAPFLLAMWLDKREYATPAYRKDLQVLAQSKQLDLVVLDLLRPRGIVLLAPPVHQVAIAVRAARYMDTPAIRAALRDIVDRDNQALAIQACESLLHVQDRDGVRLVLDLLFRYPEQARYLTTRLGVAGGEYLVRVLDPFLEKLPNARLEDIVYLVDKSDDESFLPLIERMLKSPRSAEQLASLLRALARVGTADQRSLVIPHLSAETSFVRLQASVAMGAVGSERDIDLLEPLLSDADWWVRYRTAQTCYRLLQGDDQPIDALILRQEDRYARDILRHVRSEMTWHTA